jgi:hypothetical protein
MTPRLASLVLSSLLACCVAAAPTTKPAPQPATAPSTKAPSYFIIPITGALQPGTAKTFTQSLDAARQAGATHIVLAIDTVADNKGEALAILEALNGVKDMKLVAVVRRANGIASLLAIPCEDVLVTPDATIGGFRNPDWVRAHPAGPEGAVRSARPGIEKTGRDVLLARGLMEPGIILGIESAGGDKSKLVLVDERGDGKAPVKFNGEIIKPRGDGMILTADQATKIGFARAKATTLPSSPADTDSIASTIGIAQWTFAGSAAKEMDKVTESAARRAYEYEHREQLDRLNRQIKDLSEEERQIAAGMRERKVAIGDMKGKDKRNAENLQAHREVRLAKVREELAAATKQKNAIMAKAPKE